MNKQEVIEKLQGMKRVVEEGDKGSYNKGLINALTYALNVTNQLDEPEKPVLTKEEAKWIKKLKARYISRENQLYIITRQGWGNDFCFSYYGEQVELPYEHWKGKEDIESVKRRLVDAIIYGHEVEKEKLYTVEIPNPNGGTYLALCKDVDGKLFFDAFFSEEWKTFGKCKLTESEIKEGFAWAWQFAEEVEE